MRVPEQGPTSVQAAEESEHPTEWEDTTAEGRQPTWSCRRGEREKARLPSWPSGIRSKSPMGSFHLAPNTLQNRSQDCHSWCQGPPKKASHGRSAGNPSSGLNKEVVLETALLHGVEITTANHSKVCQSGCTANSYPSPTPGHRAGSQPVHKTAAEKGEMKVEPARVISLLLNEKWTQLKANQGNFLFKVNSILKDACIKNRYPFSPSFVFCFACLRKQNIKYHNWYIYNTIPTPGVQGKSKKRRWKGCRSQRTRTALVRRCLLDMTAKLHSRNLNNIRVV